MNIMVLKEGENTIQVSWPGFSRSLPIQSEDGGDFAGCLSLYPISNLTVVVPSAGKLQVLGDISFLGEGESLSFEGRLYEHGKEVVFP